MRVVSWNVNGLKPCLGRRTSSLLALLESLQADIVCFQETKLSKADVTDLRTLCNAHGWDSVFSLCNHRAGYSGVATFWREAVATPIAAESNIVRLGPTEDSSPSQAVTRISLPADAEFLSRYTVAQVRDLAAQGRCVVTDHGNFVVFNMYGPAVTDEDVSRFKLKQSLYEMLEHKVQELTSQGCSVIVAGDLNIAPFPLDHCDYAKAPSRVVDTFYDRRWDRRWLSTLLKANWKDTFRLYHAKEQRAYTVWNQKTRARDRNHGSRVDFILMIDPSISAAQDAYKAAGPSQGRPPLATSLTGAGISVSVMGSDHCPVWADWSGCSPECAARPPALASSRRFTKGRQVSVQEMFAKRARLNGDSAGGRRMAALPPQQDSEDGDSPAREPL